MQKMLKCKYVPRNVEMYFFVKFAPGTTQEWKKRFPGEESRPIPFHHKLYVDLACTVFIKFDIV